MKSPYRGPIDALEYAIVSAVVSSVDRRKPGAVVSRLPAEQRALLQELTSDQARSMRIGEARERRGRANR